MKENDRMRVFLQNRGCAEHVVEGGLEQLMKNWEDVVKLVKAGYGCGLDDYLNDLDGRQILDEALTMASPGEKNAYSERLARTDDAIMVLLEPAGKCLWGSGVAQMQGWNSEKNWWYFMKPIDGYASLLEEIENVE